jgi:hypothetical protein
VKKYARCIDEMMFSGNLNARWYDKIVKIEKITNYDYAFSGRASDGIYRTNQWWSKNGFELIDVDKLLEETDF